MGVAVALDPVPVLVSAFVVVPALVVVLEADVTVPLLNGPMVVAVVTAVFGPVVRGTTTDDVVLNSVSVGVS